MKFIFSDSLFQGFFIHLHKDDIECIETVIQRMVHELMEHLRSLHLEILQDILRKRRYHIHDYTFIDVLEGNDDKEYYICECPSEKQN